MRLVPHAALRPHRCAAIPFVGNASSRKGFFDTGHDLPGWDPHVYISVEAVEQMAHRIGWVPAHVNQEDRRKLAARDSEIEALRNELADARHKLGAVEVLKQAGFQQQKKPGRPAKATA